MEINNNLHSNAMEAIFALLICEPKCEFKRLVPFYKWIYMNYLRF